MRFNYVVYLTLVCFLLAGSLSAQAKAKTISLQQGQVFDIIFINNTPGDKAKAAAKKYFAEIFPPAQAGGYAPLPGFGVPEAPTAGNYRPEVMVFGTWPSLAARENTMRDLVTRFPDFHAQRRQIWNNFNMTYYPVTKDFSFTTDPEKYYVVSLYWQEETKSFDRFFKKWKKEMTQAGGTTVLELTDGTSPYGYHFDPDYFILTEWASQADFQDFQQDRAEVNHKGIKHLNQFVVQ